MHWPGATWVHQTLQAEMTHFCWDVTAILGLGVGLMDHLDVPICSRVVTISSESYLAFAEDSVEFVGFLALQNFPLWPLYCKVPLERSWRRRGNESIELQSLESSYRRTFYQLFAWNASCWSLCVSLNKKSSQLLTPSVSHVFNNMQQAVHGLPRGACDILWPLWNRYRMHPFWHHTFYLSQYYIYIIS